MDKLKKKKNGRGIGSIIVSNCRPFLSRTKCLEPKMSTIIVDVRLIKVVCYFQGMTSSFLAFLFPNYTSSYIDLFDKTAAADLNDFISSQKIRNIGNLATVKFFAEDGH